MWNIYIKEYYSAIKMKQCHLQRMAGPRDYPTKQTKAEKERQTPYDITYVKSKIYKLTYLQKRNRLIDS